MGMKLVGGAMGAITSACSEKCCFSCIGSFEWKVMKNAAQVGGKWMCTPRAVQ